MLSLRHVYPFIATGMITAMDDAVSLVMRAFQKKSYMDNLLVVFTSDVSVEKNQFDIR
jgi:hypothetical protein